jgi:hypothetical protein
MLKVNDTGEGMRVLQVANDGVACAVENVGAMQGRDAERLPT